jgi:DNA polymerase-3 subunit epsilon
MNYVIVDIETTGGSPKNSKITEIALIKHDGERIIDKFETLINPEINIPDFIVRLTGINNKMVENAPKFYEVAKKIIEFSAQCIFVAHNVGFDYGTLRQEYKNLGYDFRLPHLCTVRASRYVIPGLPSYSLGKIADHFQISIEGRHRAGGDALATAELFKILFEKDSNKLNTFIQEEINPKILHPNLDISSLDELPSKTGIYKLFNENNQLIYIGKSKNIKQRVEQHLRNNTTKKGAKMKMEIARVEFEETGSELIALLKESQLIKKNKPIYNRQLRNSRFPIGVYDYTDEHGYIQIHLAQTSKNPEIPFASFSTKKEATNTVSYWIEKHELCQKLCDVYPSKDSCFHYTIKLCKGACIQAEEPEDYNKRIQHLIDKLTFNRESFYVVDKGRNKGEKSIVLVELGSIIGFGYAPFHFNHLHPLKWNRFIERHIEDRDAKTILNSFLRKEKSSKIITI